MYSETLLSLRADTHENKFPLNRYHTVINRATWQIILAVTLVYVAIVIFYAVGYYVASDVCAVSSYMGVVQ